MLLVVVPMPRAHQLLMVTVLAREAGSQRLEHSVLITLVGRARDTLRSVHADFGRLAAFLGYVDVSHATTASSMMAAFVGRLKNPNLQSAWGLGRADIRLGRLDRFLDLRLDRGLVLFEPLQNQRGGVLEIDLAGHVQKERVRVTVHARPRPARSLQRLLDRAHHRHYLCVYAHLFLRLKARIRLLSRTVFTRWAAGERI